jgi:hypothetical protein
MNTQLSALARIIGATHLFEEPGTLDEVAAFAASWFEHYLSINDQIEYETS